MSIIPSFAIGNISVNISATETPRSVVVCLRDHRQLSEDN